MSITTIVECSTYGKDGSARYRFETAMPFMPIPGTKLMIGNLELALGSETVITWDNDDLICYITRIRYHVQREALLENHADFLEAGWVVSKATGVLADKEKDGGG